MRSIIGPDSFLLYRAKSEGLQMQAFCLLPELPHGQGFIAATKIKLEGKTAVPLARDMETILSSSGWRKDSITRFSNSGNSSRKSTPRCASVTSPGLGYVPPPTIDTYDEVWCGARNGGSVAKIPSSFPTTE